MSDIQATHFAYSDESYYTAERFRSVAVVTFARENFEQLTKIYRNLLQESSVKEFKWSKLRQARERFAALKLIDTAIEQAIQKQLRIDVLIWDTHDSRHQVVGRDDIANFQRMYYHVFKNILQSRWPANSIWELFPDENSALDWETVQDYLDTAGVSVVSPNLFNETPFRIRLSRDFQIQEISQVSSIEEPLCQIADLFAGVGAYSHTAYVKYQQWLNDSFGQISLELFPVEKSKLTNREKERFFVMKHLDEKCKSCKFRVSLKSAKGFKTYDPNYPINFWVYEPQHSDDKAPTKQNGG